MRTRRLLDDQGRPIEEVESPTGTFRQPLDTVRVRQLGGDELSLLEGDSWRSRESMPYGSGQDVAPRPRRRRSGLDELRALSEQIKRRRERRGSGD